MSPSREWRAIQAFGQSFPPDVDVSVMPKGQGGTPLSVRRVARRGTFRCSSLYFEVEAPASPGIYRVRVTWDDGGANPATIRKQKRLTFV